MPSDTCPEQSTTVATASTIRRIQETNEAIVSALKACDGDYDGSSHVLVSLSRDPLSLYYDSQAGALHVLLDGTVVISGALFEQQAPVGVIDVSDLHTCYGEDLGDPNGSSSPAPLHAH